MYFLRTCNSDGTSYGGFQWPLEVGEVVTAPDWIPDKSCGHGLHGLFNGQGDSSLLDWREGAIWMVIENVGEEHPVVIGNFSYKWKMKSAKVLHVGDQDSATQFLYYLVVNETAIHGITLHNSFNFVSLVGGDWSSVTVGKEGNAIVGSRAKAVSGICGLSCGSHWSTAISGDYGQSIVGEEGWASSGNDGIIHITYWDDKKGVNRVKIGYIGEGALEPNVLYRVNVQHKFMPVKNLDYCTNRRK